MGSSYMEYRDKGFWTRDGYAELWLYLMCMEIDGMPSPPKWLQDARQDWYIHATVPIHGCVSPDFDRHLEDADERASVVLALHERVRRRVESYDGILPREVADGLPWFKGDYPTGDLLEMFDFFGRLLRGDSVEQEDPLGSLTRQQRAQLFGYLQQGKDVQEAFDLLHGKQTPHQRLARLLGRLFPSFRGSKSTGR